MEVYAVEKFRTDTTKNNDEILALYMKKEDAETHASNLNSLYDKDNYRKGEMTAFRCRVTPMQVK